MRIRPVLAAALSAAAAAVLLDVPAGAADATAQQRVAGEQVATTLYAAIDALPVAAEDRTGYVRTAFRHWIDADKNGCNTRAEVLLAEAVSAPEVGADCALLGGEWLSRYDDLVLTDAKLLDVDHVVPLAEASGASAWSAAERQAYANDLDEPRALIAVSAKSNRSKADKDVSEWLPPAEAYRCTYLTDWTVVKTRWGLSVDQAEADTLHRLAAACSNEPLTVTLAR
ncbi:GmrSD restriction endonuclease domain-containing protein [Kitasatospora griseola]|uniref:GmrSD restriction endonuclease domain-containing protein n=1 Tax=Kitasatospora griseola TaxID=2064 RepID=UPI0038231CB8